ncbi:MAG: ZIP family metal transporter [Usitatibacter sp.]
MTAIALSAAAFLSTLGGGLFALRHAQRLRLILAFTAGVLLGIVAFDLLPEIFELAHGHGFEPRESMIALVVGFVLFHALEKFVLVHSGHEAQYAEHSHPRRGVLAAAALIGHSFLDGVGIGVGFKVSPSLGVAIATAVIAHDFCDGLNTVSLMLVHRNTRGRSMVMLLLDAIAPVAGAASALLFEFSPKFLILYLGFFAGFLLYIGAADVLPEAHSGAGARKSLGLIGLTCAGAAFSFGVTQALAGR